MSEGKRPGLKLFESRRAAARKLERRGRVLALVAKATQLALRETEERRLLEGACRTAIEAGGLALAWVGMIGADGSSIRPYARAMASADASEAVMDALEALLSSEGDAPAATAAREGRTRVCSDMAIDRRISPWREKALSLGLRSSVAIPLLSGADLVGVFSLYSGEGGFFGEEEASLLTQLGLDISLALGSLRAAALRGESERRQRESELLYAASFQQSSAVKLLVDPSTMDIVDSNSAAAEFYGYSAPALRRMKVTDLNSAPPILVQEYVRLAEDRKRNRFVFRHRLASGEERDVEVFSSPIEVEGRTLLHSIVHDITEQTRAQRALAISETRFHTAFADAPVGMVLAAPSGQILQVNKAFCDMLGRPEAELASLPYPSITHLDDLEASRAAVETCVSGARRSTRLVKRYIHKDGHPVWADVSLSLMRAEGGEPISFIIHTLDIGERMGYEERLKGLVLEKDTLLTELQHRVKNNLNVVSGLLSLESSKLPEGPPRLAFANAIARVDSIAAVYEKLSGSKDQASISLRPYVEDLAKSLFGTYNLDPARIGLVLELDEARLDTKRCVSLGLILNELVSNALKYAYPGDTKGKVRVTLKAPEGRLSLSVEDGGSGIPEASRAPDSPSIGMTLVRMLSDQLGAELGIDCSRGTKVSVAFAL
jgi:PAS domain S-box-containing protein